MRIEAKQSDEGTRRGRRQVATLAVMLLLVLWMMNHARQAENWRWFFTLAPAAPVAHPAPGPASVGASVPAASPGSATPTGLPAAQPTSWPQLDAEQLALVRDDTPFSAVERALLWRWLAQVPAQGSLAAVPTTPVVWAQLARQPRAYRGRAVDLKGTVRRAHRLSAPKNDQQLSQYFELWLEPAGVDPEPIVVYAAHLPSTFPLGMQVAVPATVRGAFLKRWVYAAGDGLRTAPVVLAATLTIELAPKQGTRAPRPAMPISVLAAAVALTLWGGLMWRQRQAARPGAVGSFRVGRRSASRSLPRTPPAAREIAAGLAALSAADDTLAPGATNATEERSPQPWEPA